MGVGVALAFLTATVTMIAFDLFGDSIIRVFDAARRRKG